MLKLNGNGKTKNYDVFAQTSLTDLLNILEISYSREHRFTDHFHIGRVVSMSTQLVDASENQLNCR